MSDQLFVRCVAFINGPTVDVATWGVEDNHKDIAVTANYSMRVRSSCKTHNLQEPQMQCTLPVAVKDGLYAWYSHILHNLNHF